MKSFHLRHVGSVAALAIGLAAPAQAQDATAKPSDAASIAEAPSVAGPNDEVVVTATKRAQVISQVAGAVSAVTGDQLAKANANSLSDYITRLPGVVFNDYQPGISEVVIRGIESTTYHEQGQTTVGYYLNEIPLEEPGFPVAIPDVDTFDLNRVEVLRGPQGTLFGASTLAGLVNYIVNTADPAKFDAAAEGLIGSTRNASGTLNYAGKFMVNVPVVTDKLAVRLMGLQRFDAGFIDNIVDGQKGANDFRTRGLRGSVVATPTETTKITYLGTYQDTKLDDQTYITSLDALTRNTPRAEAQDTSFFLNSLRLDQELGFANFTLFGSVDKKTNKTIFSYPYPYLTGITTGDDAAYDLGRARANIKTVEARLASPGDGRLNWLVGVSYLHARKSSVDHIYQAGAADYVDANPDLFGGYPGSVIAPNDAIYGYVSDTTNNDWGAFGELSYKPVDQIELTVGGRYYNVRNTATIINEPGSQVPGSYTAVASSFGNRQKEDGFTPKVTIAYRPSGRLTVYATYSKGFREGGPNPNAAILSGIPQAYGSDTMRNFEGGIKTSLFNNRVTLDLTGFHMLWKNIQAREFTDAPYYYSYVINAGGAESNGFEGSAGLQITRQLRFSTNVTYQDAYLTKFLPDTFAVGGGYGKGTQLPGSSHWSIANNLSLDFPDITGKPTFEIAHRYLSKATVAFGNPNTRGDYNLVDLRASVNLGRHIRLLGFVNNLFNEYGVLNAPFTAQTVPAYSVTRPRTYGLRVDWTL